MKKEMSLRKAKAIVDHYQGSLAPALGVGTIYNTVALSFFNPGLSLSQAQEGAEMLEEAQRIVKRSLKQRRKNGKGSTQQHRNGLRRSLTKTQRRARKEAS